MRTRSLAALSVAALSAVLLAGCSTPADPDAEPTPSASAALDLCDAQVASGAATESVTVDPRPWLDANLVDIALMPATGPLSHWLDEADDWRVVYRDEQATIHVRADGPPCQV